MQSRISAPSRLPFLLIREKLIRSQFRSRSGRKEAGDQRISAEFAKHSSEFSPPPSSSLGWYLAPMRLSAQASLHNKRSLPGRFPAPVPRRVQGETPY